jgi:polynucleotide 5'-hydroxyl-kinase GRC3/NOL9
VREWAIAGEQIAGDPGVVMVIGAADSGKTTLTTFLANVCHSRGVGTAIVDADVGQSDIGPPGTIGLGLVEAPIERMNDTVFAGAYFVGSTTPGSHFHYMVAGTAKMVDKARRIGARAIFVDTTGLVQGGFGRHLKQSKFDALRPAYVVGIQRGDEIEHILGPFERCGASKIVRVPSSPRARPRSRDERRLFRERAFQRHLSPVTLAEIAFGRVALLRTLLGSGRALDPRGIAEVAALLGAEVSHAELLPRALYVVGKWEEAPGARRLAEALGREEIHLVSENAFQNLLVGLLDTAGEFVAEGVIAGIDFQARRMTIASSLAQAEMEAIRAVVFGAMKVATDGREMGRISPGDI